MARCPACVARSRGACVSIALFVLGGGPAVVDGRRSGRALEAAEFPVRGLKLASLAPALHQPPSAPLGGAPAPLLAAPSSRYTGADGADRGARQGLSLAGGDGGGGADGDGSRPFWRSGWGLDQARGRRGGRRRLIAPLRAFAEKTRKIWQAPESKGDGEGEGYNEIVDDIRELEGVDEWIKSGLEEFVTKDPDDIGFAKPGQDDDRAPELIHFHKVGKGAHSVVFEGPVDDPAFDAPGHSVALKRMVLQDENELAYYQREVEITRALAGMPGMVRFFGATGGERLDVGKPMYIALERGQGDLRSMVITRPMDEVPKNVRLRLFLETARAVAELARGGLVHRDIKPGNVLLFGPSSDPALCTAKLCDFASVASSKGGRWPVDRFAGSTVFIPPEVWERTSASDGPERDVWSLGIMLFQLTFGTFPNPLQKYDNDPDKIIELVQRSFDVTQDTRWQTLKMFDRELAELIERMLERDPKKRISAEETVQGLEKYAKDSNIDVSSPQKDAGVAAEAEEELDPELREFVDELISA